MAVFAAVITPSTDAFSMLFLWVPMSLLFELGIILIMHVAQPDRERGVASRTSWSRSDPMDAAQQTALVSLVGAGPGDPGLLTLCGRVECLRRADLVLYDRLVPALLAHAPPSARRVCVEELPGDHPDRWPLIHQPLIERARPGCASSASRAATRSSSAAAPRRPRPCAQAGIPYEIVPGVTAGSGGDGVRRHLR